MIEFIILGDMGSGEPSQYSVAKQMKKKIKNNNMFICGLGDNIYECGVSSVMMNNLILSLSYLIRI